MKDLKLSRTAEEVLKKRYLARNYRGEIIETPGNLFQRVARAVADADRMFDSHADVKKTATAFEAAMTSLEFLPNSPCLMHAGRPLGQLAACFVLPLEDSLESIFQTLKNTALIHRTGGGTGFSFSSLRPSGDTILPAAGVSGGPLSFIKLFDTATHLINRNPRRPGANMGVLNVSHPDIEAFIQAKQDPGQLCNFNLSVAIDDFFIKQLLKGGDYPLIHPKTGAEVGRRSAPGIMEKIAHCAWKTGDPGILFIDRINRDNPVPGMGRLKATNPCGEQPLLPNESCTLGSVNLTRIIGKNGLNLKKLEKLVHLGVHFLDNVIEVNRYPLKQIEERSRAGRKIGLGVMGFADMLILLGVPYQSPRALELAQTIMSHIRTCARDASGELAEKRSNFPAFEHSIFPGKGIKKRRNATLTTIAPTGTISLIAGVSSGIEPVFAYNLQRRVADTVFQEVHPIYEDRRKKGKPISQKIFQAAGDIDPEWHLKIQAGFQKFTDNAVSKTVNLPAATTEEEVKNLLLAAVELGLKGITVYRDQSLDQPILGTCSLKRDECG